MSYQECSCCCQQFDTDLPLVEIEGILYPMCRKCQILRNPEHLAVVEEHSERYFKFVDQWFREAYKQHEPLLHNIQADQVIQEELGKMARLTQAFSGVLPEVIQNNILSRVLTEAYANKFGSK